MYSLFVFLAQAASSTKSGVCLEGAISSHGVRVAFFYIGLDRQEVIMFGGHGDSGHVRFGFTCEILGKGTARGGRGERRRSRG